MNKLRCQWVDLNMMMNIDGFICTLMDLDILAISALLVTLLMYMKEFLISKNRGSLAKVLVILTIKVLSLNAGRRLSHPCHLCTITILIDSLGCYGRSRYLFQVPTIQNRAFSLFCSTKTKWNRLKDSSRKVVAIGSANEIASNEFLCCYCSLIQHLIHSFVN